MALNAIDGMLAREHDMQSPLGAMLNELGDVLSDVARWH
jgi:CDP-diacylglycerol--glycerol-3-phosphate 3-phosphatidyltransferase